MSQNIENSGEIGNQLNISGGSTNVNFSPVSRLAQRFIDLKNEVANEKRFELFIDDLKQYRTKLDGKSMSEKLLDGNFSEAEISRATKYSLAYHKKARKNRFYESAQKIDVEIFGLMVMNFETYVEPSIINGVDKTQIKELVTERVINPILEKLNTEGGSDTLLNYSAKDIMGMLYFLTGKCHINWADYDSV